MTENNQNCSLGMELDLCKTQTKNIQQKFIDYYVQKNFLDKFVTPDKTKLQEAIKIFQTFQEEHFTRGFGVIGFENLVNNLSSNDSKIVDSSLLQLDYELKNLNLVPVALKHGILSKLKKILKKEELKSSLTHLYVFKLINLICRSFQSNSIISQDIELMQSIIIHANHQTDQSLACAEILQTLSEHSQASKYLLNSQHFIMEMHKAIHAEPNNSFLLALSNFIAMNPSEFVQIEILQSLLKNTSKSAALKCLALLLNCNECQQLAIEMKIENSLFDVISKADDAETKTYATAAMRNYLTYRNVVSDKFPWRLLLEILMEAINTKFHELLQVTCIQTLRVMSDVKAVKDCLRKVHLKRLNQVVPICEDAKTAKEDLMNWLVYKNYKASSAKGEYLKLFI